MTAAAYDRAMMSTTGTAKSQQVYDYLRTNRDQLRTRLGNRLPSEEDLSRMLESDRFSVRRALRRLVDDGLLFAVRNRGYFFQLDSVEVAVDRRTSYHAMCRTTQVQPKVALLEMAAEFAPPAARAALGLEPGAMVWNLLFLRHRDRLPFCLTRSWLPRELTPGLIHHFRDSDSLYRVLEEQYGILTDRRKTVCSAVNAGRNEARLLELPVSSALLKACSTVADQRGRGVEYCESLYRGDIVSLAFDVAGSAE